MVLFFVIRLRGKFITSVAVCFNRLKIYFFFCFSIIKQMDFCNWDNTRIFFTKPDVFRYCVLCHAVISDNLDVIAFCVNQCTVDVSGNSRILLRRDKPHVCKDSLIIAEPLLHYFYCMIRRTVVCDNQFYVFVGLVFDTVQGLHDCFC